MEKKSRIKEDYDKTAGIYNERYGDIQLEKYNIMLQDLKLMKPILDLGSGTGLLKEFLKARAGIIGIDISFEMLKQGSGARVQADVEYLPFKSESFPTVVSFTALQNLEDTGKMLKEVKRVLKKDGFFLLTFLNKFMDKIPEVENHFKIIEMKTCGEDIGLVLANN